MSPGYITAFLMLLFIGVSLWAYHGKNKARFESAARLPLDDEPGCGHACGCGRSQKP